MIIFFLPQKPLTGSFNHKLRKVDFLGVFTSLVATIFILVPISGGGSSFPWSSPLVISMLSIGGVAFILFLFIEWKVAPLPIVPLRLFHDRSLFLLAWISFLAGVYFFANTYFLPIYFQLALAPPAGPILSSALQQALLLPQIAAALMSGFLVQKLFPRRCC
jgi:Fungal trichothecene efflux pump (TRI12)